MPGCRDQVDWPPLIKRMALYAALRIPRYLWRGQRDDCPPGAAHAEDFAQDALTCALEREAEWTTPNGPDLETLTKIMKNRISNKVRDLAGRPENGDVPLEAVLDKNPDAWELSTEESTTKYGTPPGALLSAEQIYFENEVESRGRRSLSSDDTGRIVFELAMDGVTKPQTIADETGLTTREVDNVKKRVRRKLGLEFEDLKSFYGRPLPGRGQKPEEE